MAIKNIQVLETIKEGRSIYRNSSLSASRGHQRSSLYQRTRQLFGAPWHAAQQAPQFRPGENPGSVTGAGG
jgi:hypothetical protein